MSGSKGKEPEAPTSLTPAQPSNSNVPPMRKPAAGSANPSASFPALWGYLEPALDHIVRSPTNNHDKAPAIDVEYHMGIHTAVYNYLTSSRIDVASAMENSNVPNPDNLPLHGAQLYTQLDRYFSDVCQELLAGAPQDDSTLIHYLVPCFKRYSAGAQSVNRLLNYVNRHYVKRAVEEDRGWLRLTDFLDVVAKTIHEAGPRDKVAQKLREKKLEELRKWGYKEGGTTEELNRAEAAAEAGSALERIVPVSSMALRRFREDVVKPLMAAPKLKGKGKKHRKPPEKQTDGDGGRDTGPKSRLARAVRVLVESKDDNLQERRTLAAELNDAMGSMGVPMDNLLRKRLEKFCMAGDKSSRPKK